MSATKFNILLYRNLLRNANNSWRISTSSLQRNLSTDNEGIVIPRRISRTPTDILQALSSTVKNDSTAAPYQFHDDPFLTPFSTNSKRNLALAQEAGRKAARFIRDENSELFQHRNAEPFIDTFSPAVKLTESTPVSEAMLLKFIKTVQVQKAITSYERMLDSKEEISLETKESLLELVCFYNEQDQLDDDLFEERWLAGSRPRRDDVGTKKNWKDNGFGERLFNSLESKSAEAFSSLICGMAKYGQAAGANEYYNQMLSQGLEPGLEVYNHIIQTIGSQKEEMEVKWAKVEEILNQMAKCKIMPNVLTLNTVLQVISTMNSAPAKQKAKSVIAEFATIGIKPSLGTYFHLLRIFFRSGPPTFSNVPSSLLHHILLELEQQTPPLQDVTDVSFFAKAMEVCNYHSNDLVSAKRLDQLLNQPSNQSLLGGSSNQFIYYSSFFKLLCRVGTPKDIMEEYNRLVPSVYSPDLNIFEEILRTINACSALEYVPQLWTDAVYLELNTRESMLEMMLEIAASGKAPVAPSDEDPILLTTKAIWFNIEEAVQRAAVDERAPRIRWSATMLGHTMKVLLQYGKMKAAVEVMVKIHESKNRLSSFVPCDILTLMLDSSIQTNSTSTAMVN